MKPSSAKAKGRLGQQAVVKMLLKAAPELQEDDIRSTSMGAPGKDILLSPKAQEMYPWSIEVKFRNKIAACAFLEQAKSNAKETEEPVAIFRENRGEWMAMVSAEYLISLMRNQ